MKTPIRQLLDASLRQKKIKIMEYYSSFYPGGNPGDRAMLKYMRDVEIDKFANDYYSLGIKKDNYNPILLGYLETFKLIKMLEEGASDDDVLIARMTE